MYNADILKFIQIPMLKDTVPMKPYKERTPDNQYKELLQEILDEGIKTESQQGIPAITRMGPKPLHYKLKNGYPLITERTMAPEFKTTPVTVWKQAVAELFAFINGARTQEELSKTGCYWWKYWVTDEKCTKRGLEPGDMGPGSYGGAFHDFPTAEGESFNQFENILKQMKERPHLRTHFITPWIPQYTPRIEGRTQKVVVCPCHGWIHLRIIDNKLTLHMFQRSADTPIGVPSNIAQYSALTVAMAHVLDLEPYEYVHSFSDAHIYENQVEQVKEILERETRPFPTLKINTEKKNLFDFGKDDFEIEDYNPHPNIKIPVAI